MLLPSAVIAKSGTAVYTAQALNFYNGGSGNNYLTIGSLSGVSDAYTGSLSMWAKFDAGDGAVLNLTNTNNEDYIFRFSDNNLYIYLLDTSGVQIAQMYSTGGQANGTGWHHIMASWNTNTTGAGWTKTLYIDDVNVYGGGANPSVATQVGYSGKVYSFPDGGSNAQISLSEIWFAPGQYVDFSSSANRALFSAGGHPISLGAAGATPTGSSPAVYLKNAAATAGTNSGTGGNFTIQGTITNTTPP